MNVDYIIVGQGIAGSTLALSLLSRGKSVFVIDRQDKGSSTRVAAGLITPLTGKGMNPAWQQERCLAFADHFYHQLEKLSGRKFYHHQPVVRLFLNEKQQRKWETKKKEHGHWAHDLDSLPFDLPYGGIEMPDGAWLDTKVFLRVVKDQLSSAGSFVNADFSESDVLFNPNGLSWNDVSAEKIILCQGAYGLGKGGWYGAVPHRSAKGEILTVWLDGLDENKRYHANGWLAPRGGGVWKAGANYDWDRLDSEPTDEGKEAILEKLRTWVDLPIEVIGHEAGVRPIIRSSQPFVGIHPEYPQVGFFNGLGSKGTLMAPAVADHFAEHLCGQCELDAELAHTL
jgi:glycine oxidase